MTAPLPLRSAITVVVGPVLWAAHFLTVYASESLVCRAGLPAWHDALIAGTTSVALLALVWHCATWQQRRKTGDQTRSGLACIAISLGGLSAVSVCFVALAAVLPACS
jgi:hypothetical protein